MTASYKPTVWVAGELSRSIRELMLHSSTAVMLHSIGLVEMVALIGSGATLTILSVRFNSPGTYNYSFTCSTLTRC